MKIGIVTQPLHANYGGILQAFALQQVLKRLGHEPWTIDYGKFTWLDWLNNVWRVLIHKALGHKRNFARTPTEKDAIELPLRRFALSHMQLTRQTKGFERKTVKKYTFDAIVVGSDQVWRPMYNACIEDCFLAFASGIDIKRVAYAASFGTYDWEFSKKQTKKCSTLAKQFDAISVREKSGVDLCKKHLGVDAVQVLDPTLLIDKADYENLCRDIPKRQPMVFAYILDADKKKKNFIESFASSKNLPCMIKGADANVSNEDSIELWLSYFRDAAYVITDSFHGCIFSIIFKKDFLTFGNYERGNSRITSLLGTFGLVSRLINSELKEEVDEIDWNEVNKKLREMMTYSEEWLKNALR